MNNSWNKCNECGKFISFKDFENGSAYRELVTPDSEFTKEEYETLCPEHVVLEDKICQQITLK